MTLLEETIDIIKESGYSESDILYCTSQGFWFSWDNYKHIANIDHKERWSSLDIPSDLVIVGNNFWLERDFSYYNRYFVLKTFPVKPEKYNFLQHIYIGIEDE